MSKAPEAYYKLAGFTAEDEPLEYFGNSEQLQLGRSRVVPKSEDGEFLGIGSVPQLSRKHANIAWSRSKGSWKIQCLSKNGFTVDRVDYPQEGEAKLDNGSAIRIASARFYFLLPKTTKKRKLVNIQAPRAGKSNYLKLLTDVFDGPKLGQDAKDSGLSQETVRNEILKEQPHLGDDARARKNLTRGIKRYLEDENFFTKLEDAASGTPRYKYISDASRTASKDLPATVDLALIETK